MYVHSLGINGRFNGYHPVLTEPWLAGKSTSNKFVLLPAFESSMANAGISQPATFDCGKLSFHGLSYLIWLVVGPPL